MGKFQIVRGALKRRPDANIVTGRSNIGKTWFTSTIPNVFFICTEDGLKGASPDHIQDVAFFGNTRPDNTADVVRPKSFSELLAQIADFRTQARDAGVRHLVLDSLSGAETLINFQVCQRESVSHMDAKAFKELWTAAESLHLELQAALDKVRDDAGCHIWLVAHSAEVTETTKDGDQFKKHDLSFKGTGNSLITIREMWRRWADNVLFIDWDAGVTKGTIGKKSVGTYKSRIFRTRETPSHYAKNRRNLPEKLPASWPDLAKALGAGQTAPDDKLKSQIVAVMASLSPTDKKAIDADLRAAKTNSALAATLSRAKGMVSAATDDDEEDQPAAKPEPTPDAPEDDGTVPPDEEPPPADEPPFDPPAPTGPKPIANITPALVAFGVKVEQASNKAEVDAAWTEAKQAFAAEILTKEERDQIGAMCRTKVEGFAKAAGAAA
jgi:hypothetical protein